MPLRSPQVGTTLALLLLGLLLLVRSATATTYYVANGGSGGSNCTSGQNSSTPLSSLANGMACLASGDTLLLRTGSYPGWDSNSQPIPSGSTFATATTVAAYPGTCVTNACETVTVPGLGFHPNSHHIIVDGFVVDASGQGTGVFIAGHHIRLTDTEIKNASEFGIVTSEEGQGGSELIRLHVHHNGTDGHFHHGIYISGDDNYLIDGCTIHDNASHGIHIFNNNLPARSDNTVIRNNLIYNNSLSGDGAGILLSGGNNNIAYNNVLYNNAEGIFVGYGASNTKVLNNTIVDNVLNNYGGGIVVFSASDTTVRNNIVLNPASINDFSGTLFQSANLLTSPGFVNAPGRDYHLTSGSTAALDTGTSTDVMGVVTTDLDGVSRPQGSGYDIGAYEFTSGGGGATAVALAFAAPVPTTETDGAFTVQVNAVAADGSTVTSYTDNITVALLRIVPLMGLTATVDSEQTPDYQKAFGIDGNPVTFWHSQFVGGSPPQPHTYTVDMGTSRTVNGVRYVPVQEPPGDVGFGTLGQYEVYVSSDCASFGSAVTSGTLSAQRAPSTLAFTSTATRCVRLKFLTDLTASGTLSSMAEMGIRLTTGGTLSGTATVAAVAGVASFDLSISPSGTYVLMATASGLTAKDSAPFIIQDPPGQDPPPPVVLLRGVPQ